MTRNLKLSIDGEGRVILDDEALDQICNESEIPCAGGDGNTNMLGCTNTASCGGSLNQTGCTNTAGACSGSFNSSSCYERPKAVKT